MLSFFDGPAAVDPYRARIYRVVFFLAGFYNLAFGVWAGLFPLSFFRVMELPAPSYPSIWACLGMVVGVYGLLYLYAARRLDRAWPIIAVGLLGKLLGPAGLALGALTGGELPGRMVSLLVFNDLCWWLAFALFLLEGTRLGERVRASAPLAAAAVHLLAMGAMALTLRPGTEVQADVHLRAAYVDGHPFLWALSWPVWMAAAMALAGFCAWWAARVRGSRLALAAVAVAALGMLFDLSGEALYLGWLPWLADAVLASAPGAAERFAHLQRAGTVLTGVFANGLYTAAGVMLTLATPSLSPLARAVAWSAWAAGIALVVSAAVGSATAMVASSAVLFPLVVLTALLVGYQYPIYGRSNSAPHA